VSVLIVAPRTGAAAPNCRRGRKAAAIPKHPPPGHVGHQVVCDTGSTDATQALIEAALRDVAGELHERPWVDFGHTRTELMALAEAKRTRRHDR